MKNLENIQEIIDAKARVRASDIVSKLINVISSNTHLTGLCSEIEVMVVPEKGSTVSSGRTTTIKKMFFSIKSDIPLAMIEKLTKTLIPLESKKFMEEVDRLKNEIIALGTYQNYQE